MIKKAPVFRTAYTDNPSVTTNIPGESLTVQADAQFLDIRYIVNSHIASNIPFDNSHNLQYADISKLKTLPEYMDTLNEITDVYNNLPPEHARQYKSLESFANAMIQYHSNPSPPPQNFRNSAVGEGVQTDIDDALDQKNEAKK